MILAVVVHVVAGTGMWSDLRFADRYGEVDIWGTIDGWSVEVTINLVLLRPGAISARAAL